MRFCIAACTRHSGGEKPRNDILKPAATSKKHRKPAEDDHKHPSKQPAKSSRRTTTTPVAMASQMMLLQETIPFEALTLGSLVESIQNPIMDAYVPKRALPQDAVLLTTGKSFSGVLSSSASTSFKLSLTRLFHTSHTSSDGEEATLSSLKVNRYVLKQPKQLFRELCLKDENARQWLNDGIMASNKSYLVVELQTATNATITRRDTKSRGTEAEVTVPAGAIATAGADIFGALDASVGAGYKTEDDSSKKFESEGESIFAVGYKKVLWKSWGRTKDIEKAELDKNITWSLMGKKRSRDDDDEMISVDLGDELDSKKKETEGGEKAEDEDEEEDEDDDEELAELLKNGVDVDGQTFLLPGQDLDE